jgi:hypothetical protein
MHFIRLRSIASARRRRTRVVNVRVKSHRVANEARV